MVADAFAEVVLPSGKFARIRMLTGRDYIVAQQQMAAGRDMLFTFMSLATMIDDKSVTYDELLDMDMRDVNAIVGVVSKFVTGPVRT